MNNKEFSFIHCFITSFWTGFEGISGIIAALFRFDLLESILHGIMMEYIGLTGNITHCNRTKNDIVGIISQFEPKIANALFSGKRRNKIACSITRKHFLIWKPAVWYLLYFYPTIQIKRLFICCYTPAVVHMAYAYISIIS